MKQPAIYTWLGRLGLGLRTAGLAALSLILFLSPLTAQEPQSDAASARQQWTSLFDGKALGKWRVVEKYDFKRHGKVYVKEGCIILENGLPGTAIRWTGRFPRSDYEVAFEGRRVEGSDFFCGMTFPVGDSALTLILGGWGGPIVGLSSIDGEPAVENETCQYIDFQQGRWYRVRLRVTKPRIEVWLDQEKIIDLKTQGRELTIYWEVEPCLPFGVATWRTTGALRNIRLRPLAPSPSISGQRQ
jgi:hypothetical protein